MALPGGIFNVSYTQDLAVIRTKPQWACFIIFLVFLSVLPWLSGPYFLSLVSMVAITIISVHGLNILTGYCGQISLGHAAFMGIGAYTSAILVTKCGLPFWLALPCAGLVAALIGIIFGLPSLRIKGLYLALATLAAHYIIMYVISHATSLTGGTAGLEAPRPILFGRRLKDAESYYYLLLVITFLMTLFAKNMARTRVGRNFIAIRDNDKAAAIMGVSLLKYKLLAFAIGCFYAGVAGSLWAHYMTVIDPDHFLLINSIWYIGMLIVGGMGTMVGVFFGVIFLKGVELGAMEFGPTLAAMVPALGPAVAAALAQFLLALIIILFLVYEPRGLAHRWEVLKASYRIWPFPY